MSGRHGDQSSAHENYWRFRRSIWDSTEPLIVKALALAILEHMRPDRLEANPSRARLARMCSISEKTLERHWGAIKRWVEIVKTHGRANVYKARVAACASELIELLPVRPPDSVGGSLRWNHPPESTLLTPPNHPPECQVVTKGNHPPERGVVEATTPQRGGYTTPQRGGTEDIRDNTIANVVECEPPSEPLPTADGSNDIGPGLRPEQKDLSTLCLNLATQIQNAELKLGTKAVQSQEAPPPPPAKLKSIAKSKLKAEAEQEYLDLDDNHNVYRDKDGIVRAANGYRASLEQLLGGQKRQLNKLLAVISPSIPESLTGDELAQATAEALSQHVEQAKAQRGTRLPGDWFLPKSWGDWAIQETSTNADWVRDQANRFKDHWTAKAGPMAKKLDWQATWRNWIRNAGKPRQQNQNNQNYSLSGNYTGKSL